MDEQQNTFSASYNDVPFEAAPVKKVNKWKRRFRKFFTWLFVLLILTFVITYLFGAVFYYSKGFREGYVYKLSNKGIIFKTWEGTLKTGFVSFNNTSTPNEEWKFTVWDKDVVEQLNKYGERTLLRLHYKQYFLRLFWRGDTKYFVEKVEALR
jgi:hypothetical protein